MINIEVQKIKTNKKFKRYIRDANVQELSGERAIHRMDTTAITVHTVNDNTRNRTARAKRYTHTHTHQ